ncbi:MAG TPA: hypothetical protein DDW23_08170, partial [Planctomycetes bacterium]|nr:hypothetical protein [Planctomycetota bacterium]
MPALLLLTALLIPQEGQEANSATRDEATFAQALATDLGFDDWAEKVVNDALKKASSPSDRGLLLLARCDVRKFIAQRATDPSSRLAALGAAGEAYTDFLATQPSPNLANKAHTNLAEVAFQYGRALQARLDETDIGPEEQAAMVTTAETIFESAIRGANSMINWWNALPPGDEREGARFTVYYPNEFYRSLTFYYWGLLYPSESLERDQYTNRALEYLADFALLVGENSYAGMLAYKHMADAYAARSETEDAEIFYVHVIENAIPGDSFLQNASVAEIDSRHGVIQEATLSFVQMLKNEGRTGPAEAKALEFHDWAETEGVVLKPSGFRILLELADQRADQGNYGAAIDLAERVARENPQSSLRLEANAVMSSAIAAAPPDADINLDILYGSAEGAFFRKNYKQSIEGFLLLLGRMGTTAQADEFGGSSYYYLGRSWYFLDRKLESSVAHQAGYELFPTDEEFANQNARAWRILAEQFRNTDPNDTFLGNFYDQAINAETASGSTTPDAAIFRSAKSHYDRAKDLARAARGMNALSKEAKLALGAFDQAALSFRKIEKGSRHFEESQVKLALCEYNRMEWDTGAGNRALELLDEYLDIYLPNPEHTPIDAKGRKIRKDVSAQADYYRGNIWRRLAIGGNLGAWEKVLAHLEGYLSRHPEQTEYGFSSLVLRMEAFLAQGNSLDAVNQYEELLAYNPKAKWINRASYILFSDFHNRALEAEDLSLRKSLLTEAVDYLETSNQTTDSAKWPNIQTEARIRL